MQESSTAFASLSNVRGTHLESVLGNYILGTRRQKQYTALFKDVWNTYKFARVPSDEKLVHAVDHSLSSVRCQFYYSRVHPDCVFRTRLDTESAKYAHAKVNVEDLGHFLHVWIRMLFGDNMNAAGGTDRLAHHACDAAWRPIFSFGESMTGSQSPREWTPLLGILDGNRFPLAHLETNCTQKMPAEVHEKVPGSQADAFGDFSDIEALEQTKRLLLHGGE